MLINPAKLRFGNATQLQQSKLIPTTVVILVVILGVYFLTAGRAATPIVATEAESGTLSSGAVSMTDTAASGGKAIKFASSSTNAGPLKISLEADRDPTTTTSSFAAGTPLYIFITSTEMQSVAFTVTDSAGTVSVNRSESSSPFDMIGNIGTDAAAAAWQPSAGDYTVKSAVTYLDGTQATYSLPISILPGTTTDIDTGFMTAWNSGSHTTLRSWFDTNVKGPATTSGTHAGGSITSQADADSLTGKRVTGKLTINGNVTLKDFIMDKAVMEITGGTVNVRNVLVDAQYATTPHCGYINIKNSAVVDLYRVQMRGIPDGIRTQSFVKLTTKYLYIHSPASSQVSCNGHHDGIQIMGGSANIQRSFVTMVGGPSSGQGILVKGDSEQIKQFIMNYSLVQGGGVTLSIQYGHTDQNWPQYIDMSNNMAAKGYLRYLVSMWNVSTSHMSMVNKYYAKISTDSGGGTVQLRDGALLP